MQKQRETSQTDLDWEDILYYRRLSALEKLEYLEQMLRFLEKITPEKAKQINKQLQKAGF